MYPSDSFSYYTEENRKLLQKIKKDLKYVGKKNKLRKMRVATDK